MSIFTLPTSYSQFSTKDRSRDGKRNGTQKNRPIQPAITHLSLVAPTRLPSRLNQSTDPPCRNHINYLHLHFPSRAGGRFPDDDDDDANHHRWRPGSSDTPDRSSHAPFLKNPFQAQPMSVTAACNRGLFTLHSSQLTPPIIPLVHLVHSFFSPVLLVRGWNWHKIDTRLTYPSWPPSLPRPT